MPCPAARPCIAQIRECTPPPRGSDEDWSICKCKWKYFLCFAIGWSTFLEQGIFSAWYFQLRKKHYSSNQMFPQTFSTVTSTFLIKPESIILRPFWDLIKMLNLPLTLSRLHLTSINLFRCYLITINVVFIIWIAPVWFSCPCHYTVIILVSEFVYLFYIVFAHPSLPGQRGLLTYFVFSLPRFCILFK